MAKSAKRDLYAYYRDAAAAYGAVDAVFSALGEKLVAFAGLRGSQRVLDVGSGWGAVTAAAPAGTIGVDFVHAMAAHARQRCGQGVLFCCGDIHRLPFGSGHFDGVLAQFAFNSTQPERAFAEARRVLRMGGMLALHEWGDIDPLSEALADAFAAYTLDTPPPEVAAYRATMQQPIAWDALDGLGALVDVINGCRFEVGVAEIREITVALRPADFVRYKLAWPARQIEMGAMPPELKRLCVAELEELMMSYRAADGLLHWQPDIVRVRATAV